MPITAITVQPPSSTVHAAYRPIIFQVKAVSTFDTIQPPVVYCDIYLGSIYYKTLSKTLYMSSGEWQFDIQDAAQEYLRKYLAPNGGADIYPASLGMTKLFCRFRSSGINTNGFIIPEAIVPVQGTSSSVPIPGTGFESNTIFAVNATLQHEDNQNLAIHLNGYKSGIWSNSAFPLTHRPIRYSLNVGDNDYYPIAYVGVSPLKCLRLHYRFKGQSGYLSKTKCVDNSCPDVEPQMAMSFPDEDNLEIEFWWNEMPYYVTGMKIEYRLTGSTGDFDVLFKGPNDGGFSITIPRGRYDYYFTPIGNCQGGPKGQILNYGVTI